MLLQWSSLMEKQWRKFKVDFSNYLKYYIFECESMLELTRNMKKAELEFTEEETRLAVEKHKLFQVKDFDLWQLPQEDKKAFDETSLMYNKKLSFPKMLPNVIRIH